MISNSPHRRRIHSHIKILACLNALPAEYRSQIHPSQISRYKQISPEDYFGHDLSIIIKREMEWIRQFGDLPTAKRIAVCVLKVFIFFRNATEKCRGFKAALRKEKHFFVELAQRFKTVIPFNMFSKLIGLDESTQCVN